MASSRKPRPRFVVQRTKIPATPFRIYDRRTRQRICYGSDRVELQSAVDEMNGKVRR